VGDLLVEVQLTFSPMKGYVSPQSAEIIWKLSTNTYTEIHASSYEEHRMSKATLSLYLVRSEGCHDTRTLNYSTKL